MPNLTRVQSRFEIPFTIVENGSGIVYGVITEPGQNPAQSTQIGISRMVLRVAADCPLTTGTTIMAPSGAVYLVGYNGPSDHAGGQLFNSFSLFAANRKVSWQRRGKVLDPVTNLEQDTGLATVGEIYAYVELQDRQLLDRKDHQFVHFNRIVTAVVVQPNDILDGLQLMRVDRQLGLCIGSML